MAKDEEIYTRVLNDYNSGIINEDLKTKALVLANGDHELAKFQYIKLKVESIKRDNLRGMPLGVATKALDSMYSAAETRKAAQRERKSEKARTLMLAQQEKEWEKSKRKRAAERYNNDKNISLGDKIFFSLFILVCVIGFLKLLGF